MPVDTPYTAKLEGQDPIAAMRETPGGIRAATVSWSPQQFEQSYAPGKWSARQIFIHLAQSELALLFGEAGAVHSHYRDTEHQFAAIDVAGRVLAHASARVAHKDLLGAVRRLQYAHGCGSLLESRNVSNRATRLLADGNPEVIHIVVQ